MVRREEGALFYSAFTRSTLLVMSLQAHIVRFPQLGLYVRYKRLLSNG